MRPKDYLKNIFVLSPLIYSKLLNNFDKLQICFTGFILFCLVSGCVYIINDITDIKIDKLHPINSRRPLASGRISIRSLLIAISVIIPLSLIFSYKINLLFGLIISFYFIINLFYSIKLKKIIIIDILIISIGFVLRVLAGGALVGILPSPWVVISTFFIALFLSCAKRRGIVLLIEKNILNIDSQRESIKKYSIKLLDNYLFISGSGAIISYAMYTASDHAFIKYNTYNLIYTVIFVIFGIFRYYYLMIIEEVTISPTDLLLTDNQLKINLVLWIITSIFIIGI